MTYLDPQGKINLTLHTKILSDSLTFFWYMQILIWH